MSWTPDQIGDLSGTTALVTGANSGIGLVEEREPGTEPMSCWPCATRMPVRRPPNGSVQPA